MSLENLLCTLVSEHNDLKLSIVEFVYNSSVNRTTYKSLHEIVYGFKPRQLIEPIVIEHLSLHLHLCHTCTSLK